MDSQPARNKKELRINEDARKRRWRMGGEYRIGRSVDRFRGDHADARMSEFPTRSRESRPTVKSTSSAVKEYLSELSEDRREVIEALRKVIRKNIDKKMEEGIQYGSIGYYLPHSVYPNGYHCDPKQPLPFAGIASQKSGISIHLFCIYTEPKSLSWFTSAWKKAGKKLDMGKSCVRVKKLDDIPLDVVGELFKRIKAKDFVAAYETSLSRTKRQAKSKKKPAKKAAKKATKKTVKKSAAKKARKKSASSRRS
jgi:hypothetical protein